MVYLQILYPVDVEPLKYLVQIHLLCQANLVTPLVSLNFHAEHLLHFTKILSFQTQKISLSSIYQCDEHIIYI